MNGPSLSRKGSATKACRRISMFYKDATKHFTYLCLITVRPRTSTRRLLRQMTEDDSPGP